MKDNRYVVVIRTAPVSGKKYLKTGGPITDDLDKATKYKSPQRALTALVTVAAQSTDLNFGQPRIIRVQKHGWKRVGTVV